MSEKMRNMCVQLQRTWRSPHVNSFIQRQIDRHTDGWLDFETGGWMDGWMDGRMDGWTDGWMDEQSSRNDEIFERVTFRNDPDGFPMTTRSCNVSAHFPTISYQ